MRPVWLAGSHFFLLIGLVLLAITLGLTANFYVLRADFRILSIEMRCEEPLHNRCERHYDVLTGERRRVDFVPLADEIPAAQLAVGAHLQKQRYSMQYVIDGVPENWQYWPSEAARLVAGCSAMLLWRWSRSRLHIPGTDEPKP